MSAHTDRNLLRGMLALQMRVVNQQQLIEAFHSWTLNQDANILDIFTQRGWIDAETSTQIELAASRHLAMHGDDMDETLAGLHCDDDLRHSLAGAADGIAGRIARAADKLEAELDLFATQSFIPPPDSGLRYRELRPHAVGGLGVVMIAQDQEVDREVALKRIKGKLAAHSEIAARFRLEGEITGKLEHPGIVPIYGMGHDREGQPYYAMRFIRGESLADAIKKLHRSNVAAEAFVSGLNVLLDRMVDVCNTVGYAHSRGVIHRDLKPDNVMLGSFGETLVVDWGLAKIAGNNESAVDEPRAEADVGTAGDRVSTLAGQTLGTPAYMSPEQAEGQSSNVTAASDIYSLGATLYAVLTGKPPIDGETDLTAVLKRVREGDFPRPRQRRPGIAPALEAICLKAMASSPGQRYASATDMGGDIRRWQIGESIQAYRDPWQVRMRRWMRRHPRLVGSGAAAVIIFALLATAALWYWDAYHRPIERYFANYTNRFGEWQGIGELESEAIAKRYYSFRFTQYGRRGAVEHVTIVDSRRQPQFGIGFRSPFEAFNPQPPGLLRGTTAAFGATAVRVNILHERSGKVIGEDYLIPSGEIVAKSRYTDDNMLSYQTLGTVARIDGSHARYVKLERFSQGDSAGYIQSWTFYDEKLEPVRGPSGAYKISQQVNASGLPVEVRYDDDSGQAANNTRGYAFIRSTHDALGNVIRWSYAGGDGEPVTSIDGYHQVAAVFDYFGNCIQLEYFDESGAPVESVAGFHAMRCQYDQLGRPNYMEFLDRRDQPVLSNLGFAIAEIEYLSPESNRLRFRGLDAKGQLLHEMTVDPQDLSLDSVEVIALDRAALAVTAAADDTAVATDSETAITTAADSNAPLDDIPPAALPADVDVRGKIPGWPELDPMTLLPLAELGNINWKGETLERFLPSAGPDGLDTVRLPDISITNEPPFIRMRLEWEQGASRTTDDGMRTVEVTINAEGQITHTVLTNATFDEASDSGLAVGSKMTRFDASQGRLEELYYDLQHSPIDGPEGFHRCVYQFDVRGNIREVTYFDPDGDAAESVAGSAGWVAEYDRRGNQTKQTFIDLERRPVMTDEGCAAYLRRFDEHDQLVEIVSLDEMDRPVRDITGYIGEHREFGNEGSLIALIQWGFDAANVGFYQIVKQFDDQERVIRTVYHDRGWQMTTLSEGYAGWDSEYRDEVEIDRRYFDKRGQPVRVTAVIESISDDSESQRQGLMPGDELKSYHGVMGGVEPIVSEIERLAELEGDDRPATVELIVRRGEEEWPLNVPTGPLGVVLVNRFDKQP